MNLSQSPSKRENWPLIDSRAATKRPMGPFLVFEEEAAAAAAATAGVVPPPAAAAAATCGEREGSEAAA